MSAPYLGDYIEDEVVHFMWTTSDSDGASITRATNGTVHVYKDNASGTEVTTGVTDTEDFDSLTGVHVCTIDLSSAVFYSVGADYSVVLKTATVDGQSINSVLAHFSIENRTGLLPTVAGRKLDVTTGGAAGIDWGNVENSTSSQNLSSTDVRSISQIEGSDATDQIRDSVVDDSTRIDASSLNQLSAKIPSKNYLAGSSNSDGDIQLNEATGALASGAYTNHPAVAVSDKTGFSLSAAGILAIWHQLTSAIVTVGSIGKKLVDWVLGSDDKVLLSTDAQTGVTIPTVTEVTNLSSGSAGISTIAESYTATTGSETGTYVNTQERDGTDHQITDDAGVIDGYYQFDISSIGVPNGVSIYGRSSGSGDDINIYGWNWSGSTWNQVGTIIGKNQSTRDDWLFVLYSSHVGTGANAGKVRVRVEGSGLTTANLYIDHLTVAYASVASPVGYANGAIHVDTNNGTAGSVPDVNGVADLPVDNWADALSLSSSKNITKFQFANGSSITLTGSSDNFSLVGHNWTLALGGQSIDGLYVCGADVSGTGTNGVTSPRFCDCHIGVVNLPPSHFDSCGLVSTFTIGEAGDFFFDSCHSGIAGTSTPVLDFGSGLNFSNINFRRYSGGIEIQNMGAGTGSYNMSLEGHGQLVINANCSASSTVAIRGHFVVTDNAGGAVTLSNIAMFDHNAIIDTIAVDVANVDGSSIPTATEIVDEWETQSQADPTGFHVNVLEINSNSAAAVRQALAAGTIVVGAAQTGTLSTTQMSTNLTEATDDHYNDRVIIWTSGVLLKQATDITDYVGVNGVLTFTATTEAPANGDTFIIV